MPRLSTVASVAASILVLTVAWAPQAAADLWDEPTTKVVNSSNATYQVVVVPKPLGYEPPPGDRERPFAFVKHFQDGRFVLDWEQTLVNRVAPLDVLMAENGQHLVTLDNWGRVGNGENVVVIYRRGGELVRTLRLEQILPPAYIRHLPRTSSSVAWRGRHRLADKDTLLELQVIVPESGKSRGDHVPVFIRLADGAVLPVDGLRWKHAHARINDLELARLAEWDASRKRPGSPLQAPSSPDKQAWEDFAGELGERIFAAARLTTGLYEQGEMDRKGQEKETALWVRVWENARYDDNYYLFLSPESSRLASMLTSALQARAAGWLKGYCMAFVGTEAERRQVAKAADYAGARLLWVDRNKPLPKGEPLPMEAGRTRGESGASTSGAQP